MKIFRGYKHKTPHVPCAVAIGNFDGVHRGHQALLARLNVVATMLGVSTHVVTFDPHPRQYFALKRASILFAPVTITPLREKVYALSQAQVQELTIIPFNEEVAQLSADEFIEQVIVRYLSAKYVIVGEGFRYGQNREGTTQKLIEAGKRWGFEVEIQKAITDEMGARVSSSQVRTALQQGDFQYVAQLLGRPYMLSGRVLSGDKMGRQLGFPTANLPILHYNPVLSGVFVTQVHGLAEKPLPAVSMIGTRPTLDNKRLTLETHILNYNEDCYGKRIQIEFLKKCRDNKKFPSLNALKEAIAQDVKEAKDFFRI